MQSQYTYFIIRTLVVALAGVSAFTHAADEAPPMAHLQVTSEPLKATVLVDRKARGETPLTLADLTPGQHLVTIQMSGFSDAHQTVTLNAQETRTVTLKLEPITGLLLVHSTPTNADILVDGLALGHTPLMISTLPLGKQRIKISTPGYQSKEVEVNMVDRTPAIINVELLSESATITVESDAEGATVIVNGLDRGAPPCTVERVPAGDVSVEVRATGYATFSQRIHISAGEVQKVKAPLTALPATLKVVSIPDKARVYVNNEFKGLSPIEIDKLAPATYRVKVELDGHEPDVRNVELARAAAKTEEFRLTANTGRMELTTEPEGVTVFIDGKKVGATKAKDDNTTISDILALEMISSGEHELRLVRKGYVEVKKQIQIDQGKTTTLNFLLVRRFIPDYKVTTSSSTYTGMLDSITPEFIRLETSPGIITPIPMKDVKVRMPLRED